MKHLCSEAFRQNLGSCCPLSLLDSRTVYKICDPFYTCIHTSIQISSFLVPNQRKNCSKVLLPALIFKGSLKLWKWNFSSWERKPNILACCSSKPDIIKSQESSISPAESLILMNNAFSLKSDVCLQERSWLYKMWPRRAEPAWTTSSPQALAGWRFSGTRATCGNVFPLYFSSSFPLFSNKYCDRQTPRCSEPAELVEQLHKLLEAEPAVCHNHDLK